MSTNSELKWGSLLSYAQTTLNVVIGIVYTPLMIRLLGQNEYGLYNTVSSTISMLSILSLGFNSGYIRFFAKYKKQGETEKIFKLNGLFLVIFGIIGLIALLCGSFLTTHLDLVFAKGLTAKEYDTARILMLLLTINLTISFPTSVFTTIISANEHFVFLKLLGMIKTILSPLVNLPLLLMGFRSIGLVTSSLVFSLVTDTIYIYYVIIKLQNKFIFGKAETGLFRSLFTYTIFIAINLIVDQINNGIDRILLGRFNGTASVAIYAVGANLYAHYVSLSTAISGVFTPRIHKLYNSFSKETERSREITNLFIKVGRIQFLILMLFASGLIFFGKQFISFWVGEGYEDSYFVLLLLMLPATIPLIQNLGIEIQRAANKHQFRSIVYFFMAICNLLLTIYLCQRYGSVGAAIGTAISLLLANGLIMNLYYYKSMGLNIPEFWANIIRMFLGMIPAFAVGAIIKQTVQYSNVWHMILFIILYAIVYIVSVWFLSMNRSEKSLVLSPVRKIINKRRKLD